MFIVPGPSASAQDTLRNQDNIIKSKAAMELYFERRARAQYIRDSLVAKKNTGVTTKGIKQFRITPLIKP